MADDPKQFDLPADASAAGIARLKARSWLTARGLQERLEAVLLVVSELVGNAVRHGRPPVSLRLTQNDHVVRISVHDEAADQHLHKGVEPGNPVAESGRGLMIVEAVSRATGVEDVPGDGKRVWADVDGSEPA